MNGKTKADNFSIGFAVGYLYKTIKEDINHLAATSGGIVSAISIAEGLGRQLLSETVRSELGSAENLPNVRRNSTQGSEAVEPVAMARGSYRKSSLKKKRYISKKGLAAIKTAQKLRWAKQKKNRVSGIKAYWAKMTPEQRSAEIMRRRAKGQGVRLKVV